MKKLEFTAEEKEQVFDWLEENLDQSVYTHKGHGYDAGVVEAICDANRMRSLLREAADLLSIADLKGFRANNVQAGEDGIVGEICERHGYGAVMDSAARQWYLKAIAIGLPGSAHTTGHCTATINHFLDKLKKKTGWTDKYIREAR